MKINARILVVLGVPALLGCSIATFILLREKPVVIILPVVAKESISPLRKTLSPEELKLQQLENDLKDPDVKVRMATVTTLLQMNGDPRLRLLCVALHDKDLSIRREIARALSPSAYSLLLFDLIEKAIADSENDVWVPAVHALFSHEGVNKFKDERRVSLIKKLFSDTRVSVRRCAAPLIHTLENELAISLAEMALKDKDVVVNQGAIQALKYLYGVELLPLIEQIFTTSDPQFRVDALDMIRSLAFAPRDAHGYRKPLVTKPDGFDVRLRVILEKGIADENSAVRIATFKALKTLAKDQQLSFVEKGLQDKQLDVKMAAAASLGGLDEHQSVPLIIKLLADSDMNIRSAATSALRTLSENQVLPILTTLITDPDEQVRRNVADCLDASRMKKSSALPLIKIALADSVASVRYKAMDALGTHGSKDTLPLVEKGFADQDSDVRSRAVWIAFPVGGKMGLPILEKALVDQDPNVRRASLEVLQQINADLALPILERAPVDQDPELRGFSARIIEKLRPNRTRPAPPPGANDF